MYEEIDYLAEGRNAEIFADNFKDRKEIRVPAIAWWPGRIQPGATTDALGITLDVMPTILSLAGVDKPKNRPLDGIDLSAVLLDGQSLPQRSV